MITTSPTSLHARSIVVDALDVSGFDEAHFLKMKEGGVTAANATVVTVGLGFRSTIEGIRDFDLLMEQNASLVMPVRTVQDILTAKASGKVGIIYGLQNAVAVEGDVRLVKVLHSLGVRVIQLTYNTANLLGDGCLEGRDGGLTIFGRAVVREMNRTGILVDVSHCSRRTGLDAIETSELPVAMTHACARGLVDHPRNKADDELRALAARGGVVGITSIADFVCDYYNGELPTVEHYLRQIDYVVNLVGVDHVGMGMDYLDGQRRGFVYSPTWGGSVTGPEPIPYRQMIERHRTGADKLGLPVQAQQGLADNWPPPYAVPDSSRFGDVTDGLLARGYAEGDIQKILGGNWLRLFREVWIE
ncbi:MAG: membrane dipeptidase [Chloroflexi bacterium]|nr:membrane dipeptidase [Chloroflexota bacterium]